MTVETTTMDTNNNDAMMMEEDQQHCDGVVELSAHATTIDPSVISSRIRQSASLQKEQQQMVIDDSNNNNNNNVTATQQQQQQQQQPQFPKLSALQASAGNRIEYRRVRCPPHRYTPLREYWEQILTPLVEYLKLQVRTLVSRLRSVIFFCCLFLLQIYCLYC